MVLKRAATDAVVQRLLHDCRVAVQRARDADPELARLLEHAALRRRRRARELTQNARPVLSSPPQHSPPAHAWSSVSLEERRKVTAELVILRFQRPSGFNFRAGQSVKLGLDGVRRSYSLASALQDPWLEFFIELRPGGRMSGRLLDLEPGQSVELGRPRGRFQLMPGVGNHLMIATVTGISPFRSMLRSALASSDQPGRFLLLHGASHQDEFGYAEDLGRLAAERPDQVVYLPSVSRPDATRNAGWRGSVGRAEEWIASTAERFGLLPENTCLYACGHPQMVSAVERHWRAEGFTVRSESY